MESSNTLIIVGPMAAGKSTIGKRLAEALALPFYDSDQVIEERSGVTVSWIFEVEGESSFRAREENVIDELTQKQNIVLATGGGAILSPLSRDRIKARGYVVYLEVSLEEQIRRTERDPLQRRPLLQAPDRKEVLRTLREMRDPLYQSVADLTMHTDRCSQRDLLRDIVSAFKNNKKKIACKD